jgi:iron-sulfur cluster assembly accessory protein
VDVPGGVSSAPFGERVAEAQQCRPERRHRQRNRFPGQRGDATPEFGGDVFVGKRQARQVTLLERGRQFGDQRQEPPLKVERRREIGSGREDGTPPPLGQIRAIVGRNHRNLDVGHDSGCAVYQPSCCYNDFMINVSETAASKISELLSEENKTGSGLRVFVQGGGCSGFQYGLMIEENGQGSGDQVFESHGVKLFIDPISIRYLNGAEVDFVDTITGGGFTIKNPNATSTCGCGSSFSVE